MVNAKEIKKRYYIFLVFYVFLFGPIIIFLLDEVVNPDFTQKYKNHNISVQIFLFNLTYSISLDSN